MQNPIVIPTFDDLSRLSIEELKDEAKNQSIALPPYVDKANIVATIMMYLQNTQQKIKSYLDPLVGILMATDAIRPQLISKSQFNLSKYNNLPFFGGEDSEGEDFEGKIDTIQKLIRNKDFQTIQNLILDSDFLEVLDSHEDNYDFYVDNIENIIDNFTDDQLIWMTDHGVKFKPEALRYLTKKGRYDLIKRLSKYDKFYENLMEALEIIETNDPFDFYQSIKDKLLEILKGNSKIYDKYYSNINRDKYIKSLEKGNVEEFNKFIKLGTIPTKKDIEHVFIYLNRNVNDSSNQGRRDIIKWAVDVKIISIDDILNEVLNHKQY